MDLDAGKVDRQLTLLSLMHRSMMRAAIRMSRGAPMSA
jgi:hypothetical protein